MSTEYYRTFEELPGLEDLGECEVEFCITSWGSPSNYVDPGDPMEAHVTTAWYTKGCREDEWVEFCPIGELDDWLMQKFFEDPPYEDDYCDDEPYY